TRSWLDSSMKRPADRSPGQDVARPAIMLHVENGHLSAPCSLEQTGDPLKHLFTLIEWPAKGEHTLLNVNDHQAGNIVSEIRHGAPLRSKAPARLRAANPL